MNKVLLTGRLTRDPETRQLASGKSVTTFAVATNEYRGQGEERAEYHNVVTCGPPRGGLRAVPREGVTGRDRRPDPDAALGRRPRDAPLEDRGRGGNVEMLSGSASATTRPRPAGPLPRSRPGDPRRPRRASTAEAADPDRSDRGRRRGLTAAPESTPQRRARPPSARTARGRRMSPSRRPPSAPSTAAREPAARGGYTSSKNVTARIA